LRSASGVEFSCGGVPRINVYANANRILLYKPCTDLRHHSIGNATASFFLDNIGMGLKVFFRLLAVEGHFFSELAAELFAANENP
jgi:hypothetical protein